MARNMVSWRPVRERLQPRVKAERRMVPVRKTRRVPTTSATVPAAMRQVPAVRL